MTQRLDPGSGWYGEFLRRDPAGMRACLDGAAMPPWDVLESLLRDLAAARGAEPAQRETVYAARLRAAAVTAWDRLPGGTEELRTQLAAAADRRAESETALRALMARLGSTADPAEADALSRELSWVQDDAARAMSRHADLTSRLSAVSPAGAESWPGTPARSPWPGATPPGPAAGTAPPVDGPGEPLPGLPRQRAPQAERPVGRAEGRWLRGGARRAGGARYAGSPAPEPPPFTPPPGHPGGDPAPAPAPRGARFGPGSGGDGRVPGRPRRVPNVVPPPLSDPWSRSAPEEVPRRGTGPGGTAPTPTGTPFPAEPPAGSTRALVGELVALRAQGRGGEAHALLCEAAGWPADRLPGLAAELLGAGLAADWGTLLWEAASLPPERLAEAAAALGEAGRETDSDRLLRQGVSRPTAEVADAALALGGAGRPREADALLDAFVRVRTAEEAADLARRDPRWFAPRLLRAAAALSATHRRDLSHALRVAGIATA
ncbi:hypothetical protein ACGFYU_16190 [Streptomyces sp. NPDC048337]|uniref:hypothetical protein n=1 Tax=Streptomyces sp. NPDC048337 TaxID=3365535 RepID=UPI00371D7CEA